MSEHHHRGHVGPQGALGVACVVLGALICAALLAACSSSSGGAASASASPSPTPVPSPHATTWPPPAGAVEVVRRFWDMVGEGRLAEAQKTLVAPGSSILRWDGKDIASAHYVGLVRFSIPSGAFGSATTEFAVTVWVEPSASVSPWGPAAEHTLFEQVVRMSDGTWRMWGTGTGP